MNLLFFRQGWLYILQATSTGQYNRGVKNVTETMYTKIYAERGEVVDQKVFGNTNNTNPIDLDINEQGVFILLEFGSGMSPTVLAGTVWNTTQVNSDYPLTLFCTESL